MNELTICVMILAFRYANREIRQIIHEYQTWKVERQTR